MAFKGLTNKGRTFIEEVCRSADEGSLLSGNNGSLPYSDPVQSADKVWTANVPGVNNNIELGERLILLFNKYAREYDLDANILAAQAYAESNYRIWVYNKVSTASGIAQFTTQTIYSVIVSNTYQGIKGFTDSEIASITNGLTTPTNVNSYNPTLTSNEVAKRNRPILHQNIINNLDIIIKAQARYMRYISDRCDNLASAALICYSRGPAFADSAYSKVIQNIIQKKGEDYLQEGLDYVIKIFGILGDPKNKLVGDSRNNLSKGYKPKDISFGYENSKYRGAPTEETLFNLTDEFDSFNANVSESDDYGILADNVEQFTDPNGDKKALSVITQDIYPYRLLYFPENQYRSGPGNKLNKKLQIVLHHTVSGPSVQGDVYYWQNNGERVATAFLVSRKGEIYQLYNSHYWGIHLFFDNKPFQKMINEFDADIPNISVYRQDMEKYTIGIELDSWGGLTQRNDGAWINTAKQPIDISNVQIYSGNFPGKRSDKDGFRDYLGFEKYTPEQIAATGFLIKSLQERWNNIPLTYNEDMWDFSPNAMNNVNGVWTHVSYREDKSDCHPQPELINMLKNL